MKAILIDPMFNTIKEVQYDGDYKSIYRLIGYSFTKYQPRAFDVVRIPVGFDGIYVDDEGLYAELQFRWEYRYNRMHPPIQLVNKGLVLGCDDEGDSISPDSTVESIRRSITWEWTNEKKVKTA